MESINEIVQKSYGFASRIHFKAIKRSIFEEISDCFYRENFHSDILRVFISYEEVYKRLLIWVGSKLQIAPSDYDGCTIKRESDRIDIQIISKNGKRCIIIENKSNGANDMPRQLIRYNERKNMQGIQVDAIIYLNKDGLKEPSFDDWTQKEIDEIRQKLIVTQLVGPESITNHLIDPVINETSDIRVSALAHEIKILFKRIVLKDTNTMEMNEFDKYVKSEKNYIKLKEIVDKFNELPSVWARNCKTSIESKSYDCQILKQVFLWRENYVAIDFQVGKDVIAIDVVFQIDKIDISMTDRKDQNLCRKLLDEMGLSFPFPKEMIGDRYRIVIEGENVFDDEFVYGHINRIVKSMYEFLKIKVA
jgi:hypothetical protein